MGSVFANGLGDLGSIPGHVIPKTLKMVLDTSLLNTQQYKIHIKSKVEQPRERSSAPPYLNVVAIEKGAFGVALDYSYQLTTFFNLNVNDIFELKGYTYLGTGTAFGRSSGVGDCLPYLKFSYQF